MSKKDLTDERVLKSIVGACILSVIVGSFFGLFSLGIGLLFLGVVQAIGLCLATTVVSSVVAFFPLINVSMKILEKEMGGKDE